MSGTDAPADVHVALHLKPLVEGLARSTLPTPRLVALRDVQPAEGVIACDGCGAADPVLAELITPSHGCEVLVALRGLGGGRLAVAQRDQRSIEDAVPTRHSTATGKPASA